MAEHRPGDEILDRVMPDASKAAREEARAQLYRLVDLIIRVHLRLERESGENSIRADTPDPVDLDSGPQIS